MSADEESLDDPGLVAEILHHSDEGAVREFVAARRDDVGIDSTETVKAGVGWIPPAAVVLSGLELLGKMANRKTTPTLIQTVAAYLATGYVHQCAPFRDFTQADLADWLQMHRSHFATLVARAAALAGVPIPNGKPQEQRARMSESHRRRVRRTSAPTPQANPGPRS